MKALILVDLQNDFLPGGALAVPEGDKLTVIWADGKQQEWMGLAVDRYHVLVQSEKEAKTTRPRVGATRPQTMPIV